MTQRTFAENLNDFPVFRVLAGTVAGIVLESVFSFGFLAGLCGIALFLSVLCFTALKRLKHKYVFLSGLSFWFLWVFFGIFIVNFQKTEKPDFQHFEGKIKYAVVEMPLEEKSKSFKTAFSVVDSLSGNKYKIWAYFEKDSTLPECGDLMGFVPDFQPLRSSGNPLEFDFAEYSARQGIYCSVYLKKGSFKILQKGYQKNFRFYGSKLREKLLSIYKSFDFVTKELSVLEALTLGYKADLDEETVTAFQKSGSMHILAVSGLHTGIILLIINVLLKYFDRSKKGKYLKFLITVFLLWLFAAVTGFSPSVCRSALMFSLLAFAKVLNRPSSGYTTLAFSAFVLLVIDPMLLFNIGFLLSYFAVLSILSIMPLMQGLLLQKDYGKDNTLKMYLKDAANYFIGIVLVSVAAQAGTGVLSVCVFGQFPVYFMLTNVIVIPAAFLIMVSAVLLLTFSALASVSAWIASCLNFLLKFLIASVTWVESLPGSCVEDIFMTKTTAVLLYTAVCFFVLFLIYKKVRSLKISLLMILTCVVVSSVFSSVRQKDDCLIVWNRERETCISFSNSDSCTVLVSKQKVNLTPVYDFAKLKRLEKVRVLLTDSLQNMSDFGFVSFGKKVFVLDDYNQLEVLETGGLNVDYLIVTKNINVDSVRLKNIFSPQKIIYTGEGVFVDGKNSEFLWKY
jgi:competence protein ComEC